MFRTYSVGRVAAQIARATSTVSVYIPFPLPQKGWFSPNIQTPVRSW